MDLGLAGRVFVLTGASQGLGLGVAQTLVDEGASVVLSARHRGQLEASAQALGERAQAIQADLADPDAAERLVSAALERFGRLDGALISVGGPPEGTPMTITDEQWRTGFESVFVGAVRMIRTVADSATRDGTGLSGTGPSIVAVLSTSARSPIPGLTVSNGLRPGLAMLVKDFGDELGPRGIRINGLLPGRIATDRTLALDGSGADGEAVRARRIETIPLRRYGDPAEIGRAAAFLLSPAASYLTGSLVAVDGGALRAL